MSTLGKLLQGCILGFIIGSIAIGFMIGVKASYDHIEAVRVMIDTIGSMMLHNPFV